MDDEKHRRSFKLREVLIRAVTELRAAGVPSPEVDARELVTHALKLSRVALLTRGSDELSAADHAKVWALIEQRAARVPLQHLLGEVEWGGVVLKTDARALVPRPETEVLLTLALAEGKRRAAEGHQPAANAAVPRAAGHAPLTVLDIGTGTGALALALNKALAEAEVWATDLSPQALTLARENAALNGLDVRFVEGSLFAGLAGPFDLIVSNPPYLPDADRLTADPEVRHDPDLALYSGADGLGLARRLVAEAAPRLTPGGTLLLELDPRNVEALAAEMTGWHTEVLPDLTGRQRFLRAVLDR